jgi:hypothetical protein
MQKPHADKTIVFSEHDEFKVDVMVTCMDDNFVKNIFTHEKPPKNIIFNYEIINSPNIYMLDMLLY